jgi:hypothetical protein
MHAWARARRCEATPSAPPSGGRGPRPRADSLVLGRFSLTRIQSAALCAGTCLTAATSAPGLASPLPHLRRDLPHPCLVSAGTGLTPATFAPGLGSPLPHLRWDWTHPCHICAGTCLTPATSAPGLASLLPHLCRDWVHPCHICPGVRQTPGMQRTPGVQRPPFSFGPSLGMHVRAEQGLCGCDPRG